MPIQRAKPRFVDSRGTVTADQLNIGQIGGRRNMVINGGMQVAQRGTSLAMAHDGNTANFLIDRYQLLFGGSPSSLDGTYAQVADHPLSANGKSLKWTTGTTESAIAADEQLFIVHKVEAQNLQHLNFGSSNALTTTLSFYVKCSIAGTFSISLRKDDTTKRISNRTYTINSADTWEKKTFTFTGDTDSGAEIVNDNGEGIRIMWHLMAGSNYVGGGNFTSWKDYAADDFAAGLATNAIATTGSATWQLADVQWEVGSEATPFEQRSFGEELQLCQRYYYERMGAGTALAVSSGEYQWAMNGIAYNTTLGLGGLSFPTPMRITPTLGYSAVSHFIKQTAGRGDVVTAINLYDGVENATTATAYIQFNSSTSTAGGAIMTTQNASARLNFDAEL